MPQGRRYGTDGLDGALVGRGLDGPTLAPAGTGAPPLVLEGQWDVGSGGWYQLCRFCKGTYSRGESIYIGESE